MLGREGGAIGNGWAFTPELANTPLIVMDPRNPGWHINYAIGSQVDFLPSVLDLLNVPLPSGQLYEGRSMYHQDIHLNRRIYLNTCQQFGILEGNRIIVGERDGEGKQGEVSKATAYTISNQGTKTLFAEAPASAPLVSIKPFDEFQENFLCNYSVYCQSVCKNNPSLARPSRETTTSLVDSSHR